MSNYTATEAARMLGKTEKTIRKWISAGKIPATEVFVRGVKQWQIAQSDLDALAMQSENTSNTSTGTPGMLVTALETTIEAMQTRETALLEHVEALEARVHQLEEYLHRMTAKPPVIAPTAVHAVPALAPVEREASELGMPLTQACELVGLSRRQLSEVLKKQDIEQRFHTAIPIPARPGETNRYMNSDQVEAFKVWRAK